MTFLIDTTVRVSLLMALALGGVFVFRHGSAAARHWLLAAAIGCSAAIPLLQAALPSWRLDVGTTAPGVDTTIEFRAAASAAATPRPAAAAARPASVINPSAMVVVSWLAGAIVGLSVLIVGLLRLSGIASAASQAGGRHRAVARDVARALGLRRPVTLLQSTHPTLLVTWGFRRPAIVLPAGAADWPEDRLRVVLRHELAHVSRGDWPVQMLAEVLRALYWFNPIIWLACRRLRDASERACDDVVLDGGVEPADYASHLLDLARIFTAMRRAPGPALAMARSSNLEGRIGAMLDTRLNRRPLSRRARMTIATVGLALTVPIAIAAQSRFSTLSGTIVDQTNRVVPEVTVSLGNAAAQSKYEVRSDRNGRYEFAGLPSGDYELRAAQPGFALLIQKITVAGSDVTRNLEMEIGSVHETITVSQEAATTGDQADRERRNQEAVARAKKFRQEAAEKCAATGAAGDIGGNILAPMKVKDVKPVYPEQLKASNVTGVVTLDAVITTDGTVRDVKAPATADPQLAAAAIEAVRQWEFTTTYLNCAPIEVKMQVTVNFAAR